MCLNPLKNFVANKLTMDFDLDDLLSIDAANNVKASTKFKPKPKPKPKTQSEPISTPTPSTQVIEAAVTTDNERTLEEQPTHVNQISVNINEDPLSSFEKPQEENGESCPTLESHNDFLSQSTTLTVSSPPVPETPTIHVPMDGNSEKGPTEPDLTNGIDACANLESLSQIDPLTGEEASIFNDNEDFHIENLSSVSKDVESSLYWEPLDILTESRTCAGPKVGKFKPKPKAQTRKPENIHSVPSETDYMDNASVPSFTPDELFGTSSIGITDSIPTNVNEESLTFTDFSQVDSVIPEHLDAIPETPSVGHESVKKGKGQPCEPSPENQASRSSERLRRQSKKSLALVDEFDNEGIHEHGNEENNNNINNNDNNNIDDYRPENETLNERKGRKSKKPVNEKEKPVRKRKKASEVPESTKVKKKFPHSTRRNKRQVDPELLKLTDDQLEMNMNDIPMKELIRLAEHKERIAKKEASTSGTPALNQSGGSFSNLFDEDEAFGEGNEHDYSMEAENVTYYNYRTHMKITPRMKWSKQDTELFYEAVQQFGTDLSMIKECFPGRTREQIKSKYKKEERQQPLRLNDALTTRFKGNSHFVGVIERLKEAQGQDSENEEPNNLTGEENEDDVAADINEAGEATKPVESEKEVKDKDMGGDDVAVGSPTKSDESEDDMFRWSQYKSEI
ncbi:hypothetical protein L2E82_02122 [Cichorium intybus]|uniref:Uncharacterized protein n=1 Tax=Cichorium intybus TaxID=13427 RepID=A0ACB9H0R3_CICIN|nr:hypothetical protein L2E82_02122 [Cichorium intybus]